eukprot:1597372-Prymnesium_polylepis.1
MSPRRCSTTRTRFSLPWWTTPAPPRSTCARWRATPRRRARPASSRVRVSTLFWLHASGLDAGVSVAATWCSLEVWLASYVLSHAVTIPRGSNAMHRCTCTDSADCTLQFLCGRPSFEGLSPGGAAAPDKI